MCFTYYMSFASGCECSIPQNVNSPSIKFTRKVLHKIRKESDLLANATTCKELGGGCASTTYCNCRKVCHHSRVLAAN